MYYILEGKLEYDDTACDGIPPELPDPSTYPELVQFSVGYLGHVVAVDRDGYVWFMRTGVAKRIPKIDNIQSVYVYHNDTIMLSMITNEDRLVNASLSEHGKLLSTNFIEVPKKVATTNFWFALSLDGDVYKLSSSRFDYRRDSKFPKIMKMTSSLSPIFLCVDKTIYNNKGKVIFEHEDIHSVYGNSIVTKDGKIYSRSYTTKEIIHSYTISTYRPDDIFQMNISHLEFGILYKDGVLIKNIITDSNTAITKTITGVSRIKGIADLVPKSKSARKG